MELAIVEQTTSARPAVPPTGPGTTVIADGVVAKVAGIAAREVPGVHALGGSAARALGAIREALSVADLSPGVSVTTEGAAASIAISIVVEYPHELQKVAGAVRNAVETAIETIVGMQVTSVDVTVKDVHQASDDTVADVDEADTPD
ncbi:Asp23/Gls24 family envelope stress response protein [Cryobacterium sp. TMT2-17-1]|uniref:Asp23/Gls24 family envelope stress response protein n=1 Tax=unclassified Cryobacterium TaxID=2649013 RepID=UPI0010693F7C|nr:MULTISPECIES: Asp23/Gls24 family envelope stress response protein [unclassified Cryobacterium]TFC48654.1 Asp23/Gls24 family envelope stress response protein [Cryobacterium sp. TMT2-17-1]TFC68197.1 Asp23/Gls24 family envelope stress response protein [Cryobacterium sp. TMT2-4]